MAKWRLQRHTVQEIAMPDTIRLRAHYYQHYDADFSRDVPEEGFGGWKSAPVEIAANHTAVVVMHAWDCGDEERYPGWHRAVPYIPRAAEIGWRVFPNLLTAVRRSPLPLFHVVGSGEYYKNLPGYLDTKRLAGPEPESLESMPSDPVRDRLLAFKKEYGHPGLHNLFDIDRGFARLDFAPEARPAEGEPIAENSHQLFALCRAHAVNHLIYAGFAVDGCLLISPGGMVDMQRRGIMCSVLRDATTAIETRETAHNQMAKEIALWRVAVLYGFVFDVKELVNALAGSAQEENHAE